MAWSKRACEHLHAKNRAKERYGIDFTRKKHDEVVCIIHSSKFLHTEELTRRVRLYDIMLDGVLVRILFDRKRQQVITFLPIKEAGNDN